MSTAVADTPVSPAPFAPPQRTTTPEPPAALPVAGGLYRFSVDQYHRMIESGILTEDERVELLEGVIVDMTPIGPLHRYTTRRSAGNLSKAIPSGWDVWMQDPVTLEQSEPIPDIFVVRGSNDDYRHRHPGPADIGLLVETSDSSLGKDRGVKVPIYAAAKVQQYWIINLVQEQVEVHSDPHFHEKSGLAEYRLRQVYRRGDTIALALDGKVVGQIAVSDLLPPPE